MSPRGRAQSRPAMPRGDPIELPPVSSWGGGGSARLRAGEGVQGLEVEKEGCRAS